MGEHNSPILKSYFVRIFKNVTELKERREESKSEFLERSLPIFLGIDIDHKYKIL
jgi:hypothetical protein